jgi:glycosyltransferase involved in cell wall biosynthesis
MKLCFLANANSIHSYRWIKYFADKGHEINWISLQKNEFGDLKNVKFYLLKQYPTKFLDIILNAIPVKKLIKEIKPDILHAHYAGVNGILGALSGFHPFVLTAWGSDILVAGKNFLTKPLIKLALKRADLITCDAEHMKETMMKLGVNPEKIKIIYFGVDTKKFCPGPKDKELIKKLGIENCPVVISLRNLEPIYDVETLIRAIPLVLKEVPSVKFIIGGKGSEEEKLKNLAKELKISESVRFVGFIPNDELPKYLRTVDVYVSTSLSDAGISASTAEAMACGLPVIITKTGENEKWVKDGEGGYLIPIKNPKILAEKIIYLIKNEKLKKEFGKVNRTTIEEKNNYYKEMEKMEKLYEEIANLFKG